VDTDELDEMKRLADSRGLTLAEWVRQALRAACQRQPSVATDRKLAHVRAALRHRFPAPSIEQMLDEIARGYDSTEPM